jgi:hypothetical protein
MLKLIFLMNVEIIWNNNLLYSGICCYNFFFYFFYLHINNTISYNKLSELLINAFNNFIVYFNSHPQITKQIPLISSSSDFQNVIKKLNIFRIKLI